LKNKVYLAFLNQNPMKKILLSFLFSVAGIGIYAQCVTPAAPSPVTASPSSVCSNTGGTSQLNATSTGNTIAWYTAPTGGTLLGYSASAANFPVTAGATTTYYAEAISAGSGTITQTFSFTGAVQFFVVPAGVDSVTIETWGAQGNSNAFGVLGGQGGYATGKLDVNAGDTLWIYVGGGGTTTTVGGYNGGGTGGNVGNPTSFGGGGGGASDVRYLTTGLGARVIVGAGGGGAAGNRVNTLGRGTGGGGGAGFYGGGGGAAWPSASTVVPTGGTQSAGGIGGTSTYTSAPNNNGGAGGLGFGGTGGHEVTSNQGGSQNGAGGAMGGGLTGSNGTYAGNFSGQSGAGGSSYFGTLTNGSTTAGIRSGNGQVRLTYTPSCPSATRTPVTFTVTALPTVFANASSTSLCDGTSLTLSGGGASTYSWSGPVSVTDNVSFTVSMAASGLYTVTGTDVNGCSNTGTVNITVNPLPTLSVSALDTAVCIGDTVTMMVSGANNYVWSTGGTSSTEIVVSTSTMYVSVVGTETVNGCSSPDSLLITVNSLPTVSVSASGSAVCIGSSISITASGGTSYVWSTSDTTAVITQFPTTATTYSVLVTDANGCSNSDSISIGVNALPTITFTASDTLVCPGSSVTITASGGNMYSWSTSDTTATITESQTVATIYSVLVTDANGCSASDFISIGVNALPASSITASDDSVCAGASVTLTAAAGYQYSWSSGGTSQNETVAVAVTTTFVLTTTDPATTCSINDTMIVVANALPIVSVSLPVTTVCLDDAAFTLTGATPLGGTWTGPGVSGSTFTPAVAGVGTFTMGYSFTDANGCFAASGDALTVDPCVGVATVNNENSFTLYPNPAADFISMKWDASMNAKRIDVVDMTGRMVMTQSVNSVTSLDLNIAELPAGIYSVNVITEAGMQTYRVVKN
jgi:Glycine rich protein/Secretion system C-terminal sorting domain/Ig-like domain CHU_C associated